MPPDNLHGTYEYSGNSTQRMLENLKPLGKGFARVYTFDCDASEIGVDQVPKRAAVVFIDGEHTDNAAFSDFLFALKVVEQNGVILFHDAGTVLGAIRRAISHLQASGVKFCANKLGGSTFGVFLGACPALLDPHLEVSSSDGWRWLLFRTIRSNLQTILPDWLWKTLNRFARSFLAEQR